MQPSDSLVSSAAALVPLAFGLPRCGRFSSPPGAGSAYAQASEKGSPDSPWLREVSRKTRASQVPGPSSSCVPWSKTPPGAVRSSPISHGTTAVAFRQNNTLGTRKDIVLEATHPRPTRSRAYASPAASPRPSQGSLPARAGSPLAGRVSHPLDDVRSFMETSQPPFPFDQPCLVALIRLPATTISSPASSTRGASSKSWPARSSGSRATEPRARFS